MSNRAEGITQNFKSGEEPRQHAASERLTREIIGELRGKFGGLIRETETEMAARFGSVEGAEKKSREKIQSPRLQNVEHQRNIAAIHIAKILLKARKDAKFWQGTMDRIGKPGFIRFWELERGGYDKEIEKIEENIRGIEEYEKI